MTYLPKRFTDDPENFVSHYCHFDLNGQEARDNVWDLLYDYCLLNGVSVLTDLRHR
ncbi:MAG: hypothetical protein Q8Q12_08905 [bacterium]|nr:hypothetical protein [bacterium]